MDEWLRERPLLFALFTAAVMMLAGLQMFGDIRPALIGSAVSALLIYSSWRPGGFGWRLEARERRLMEERGGVQVRPLWLLRAALAVVGVAFILFLVLVITS